MKKFFGIGKKKKSGPSPSPSETGSVLSVGYELKDKDLSKLHRAASAGEAPKIRQLLHKQDINQVDKENRTPLHLACANGHLDAVKLLVESKAKLNLCDNDGRTPLIKTIQCQHEHCATVLLEHNADPNIVDVNGNSALHLAALIPSLAVANQLLEHGANIDAVNNDGCTPLVLAATENHQEMVECLIKEGADVNSKDKNGRTSLMVAASNGQISLLKYLLQNNADLFVKDESGWTADDHAVMNGHHACSHLIIEHGSKNKRPSLYGGGKKGTSVFSSPDRVVEGGFTLGSPAIDKEGTDDFSQGDSESHVSGKADSWPSSDEDDLDFSPKKTSKPSLTQLLSSKKKVNENGNFTAAHPKSFALQSKSDSEEDSSHGSEDEDANILPPPKPVPEVHSFPQPVIFTSGSFTKPPQLASASLHSMIKERSFSSDEDDDEDSEIPQQSFTANTAGQSKVQTSGDVAGRKVALMSELGLEDDDVESPWDSESASDSPRKQSTSEMPTPAAPVHMQCISEESHEDVSEKSSAQEINKKTVWKIKNGSSTNSLSKLHEKNSKSDLMADLGLDDADDIEDASDWDSTSHSLKYSSPLPKVVAPIHQKFSESTPPQTVVDGTPIKSTTASPAKALSFKQGDNHDYQEQLKKENIQSTPKAISQDSQNKENGLSNMKSIMMDQNYLKVEQEKINVHRKMELEQSITVGDNELQTESSIQPNNNSAISSSKDKNGSHSADIVQSGPKQNNLKKISKQQKHTKNEDMLEQFHDSTFSERSQKPSKRTTGKPVGETNKNDDEDDMDDFSQSSDSVTEDYEVPTSAFRNAMLLIEQLNLEGQDSVNVLKIQNIIHEYERVIENENKRHALLTHEVKKLREERKEMHQMTEKNRELKSMLEYTKVEWDSDVSSLRSSLKQEEEKRKSAEMLQDMSKEQLRRKEEQCRHEIEEKQQLELTLRNLELEMRSLRNSIKQVEEERNESQRLYTQEHSVRLLQEEALNNLKRKTEEDNRKLLTKSAEQVLGEPSESLKVKEITQKNITLQEEIHLLKKELEQVQSRYQEEECRYLDENEALKEKIDDLRKDLKVNEETLTQTVIQCNGQLNALKTETNMLCSKLEHEKQSKERLETELESIRSRLNSSLQDLERSQISKTETERTLQRERDDWLRSKDKLNHDLSSLRESHNNLSQQLSRAEAKSNGLENDLHRTGLSLQEKTLLLESSQRDLKEVQSRIKDLERLLQVEKDQTNKSSIKQETMQERLAQLTSENMQLRQQVEEAQNKGIIKEKAVSDVQDRFSDIFSKLRADTERQVQIVEERNKDLINKSNELREQIYKLETEKVERESSIRQLQQELADALKKLSMSEASLEVITRYRNDLEEEKQHLHKELEKFRTKVQDVEEQFLQSERRNHQLKNLLDDKEREVIAAFQKVQDLSSVTAGNEKSVKQLEEHIQKLEIENAKIEATAKQQSLQIETLQKELQESISIRNRLEDLVTGLQTSKIGLEEKLNQQVNKQTVLSQSAQDSHNLWEEELKSRSRLGVRLAELDRSNTDLVEQVENEKKKVRKLLDQKKSMEERFDQEIKRNNDLQHEISGLKKHLKIAKKKLKEFENGEKPGISMKEGSFRRNETDSDVLKLKEKIEELSSHLESDSRKYTQLETSNRDLHDQLSSMKSLHKSHERLERSKRQLEDEVAELRRHISSSKLDQSYMEQYKREIDERSRQELRQKLEEVNIFLQAQAASKDKLEQLRAENDATSKNHLEHRIQDLESELNKIRNIQEENLSQKDSSLSELSRIKDLYAEEQKVRKSLTSKLERANERLADANAKLLNERQRSKSLFASSFLNGSLHGSPLLDTSPLGGLGCSSALNRSLGLGGSYLDQVGSGFTANEMGAYFVKMQQELEKKITNELDQANAELDTGCARVSPVGSTAGSMRNLSNDQDLVSQARQQYLEVLKKNYKI